LGEYNTGATAYCPDVILNLFLWIICILWAKFLAEEQSGADMAVARASAG